MLLFHECGHAWHDAMTMDHQTLFWNLGGPSGFEEFPSTSLPFLLLPYCALPRGGFATEEQVQSQIRSEIERIFLRWLPDIIRLDRFQHWLYCQPTALLHPTELDAKWLELSRRCFPWIDWEECAEDEMIHWQRQSLMFTQPFYMIEYALAQFGAIQLYQRFLTEPEATWNDFQTVLAAGNTRSLGELYRLCQIALPFKPSVVSAVSEFAKQLLAEH